MRTVSGGKPQGFDADSCVNPPSMFRRVDTFVFSETRTGTDSRSLRLTLPIEVFLPRHQGRAADTRLIEMVTARAALRVLLGDAEFKNAQLVDYMKGIGTDDRPLRPRTNAYEET